MGCQYASYASEDLKQEGDDLLSFLLLKLFSVDMMNFASFFNNLCLSMHLDRVLSLQLRFKGAVRHLQAQCQIYESLELC